MDEVWGSSYILFWLGKVFVGCCRSYALNDNRISGFRMSPKRQDC